MERLKWTYDDENSCWNCDAGHGKYQISAWDCSLSYYADKWFEFIGTEFHSTDEAKRAARKHHVAKSESPCPTKR